MKEFFSIGEVAKINDISIDRLRNYDKIGLLKPSFVDPNTGYRYYSEDKFRKLRFIKYLRKIGTPLKEINLLLNKNTDSNKFTYFLEAKINDVEKEIENLKIIIDDMKEIKSTFEHNLKVSSISHIYKKKFDERYVLKKTINKPLDFIVSHREQIFSEFKREINSKSTLRSFEKGIYLKDLNTKNNSSTEIYFLLKNSKELYNFIIPSGEYLCLSYKENKRDEAITELYNYLEENNITVHGPILNLVLTTLPKEDFQFQIKI